MRIVIAEDSALERRRRQWAVADLGHECLGVADGAEAWQLVQAHVPQVVISDRVMPGLLAKPLNPDDLRLRLIVAERVTT